MPIDFRPSDAAQAISSESSNCRASTSAVPGSRSVASARVASRRVVQLPPCAARTSGSIAALPSLTISSRARSRSTPSLPSILRSRPPIGSASVEASNLTSAAGWPRPSSSQARASSSAVAAKYFTRAIVNGLQNAASPRCQVFSPTIARRSIDVKWLTPNFRSCHSAPAVQPWKSRISSSTRTRSCLPIASSTTGTNAS